MANAIPTIQNTQEALQALIFARSYLDDYYNNKKASPEEDRAAIGFASKYLAEARAKDPHVTIAIPQKDGTGFTQTQDMLASEVLYLEACTYPDYPTTQRSALEAIKKSIAYCPSHPYLHRKAAEIFLKLDQRAEASAAADYALSLDPSNIESRKLVDKIGATPTLGVKQKEPGSSSQAFGWIVMLGGLACMILGPIVAYNEQNYIGMVMFPIFIGFPIFWVGTKILNWSDGTRLLHKAMQEQKYKGK